jgi:hypothetical protein
MNVRRLAITQYDLGGTPMFLINGEKIQATEWAGVEPLLKALGG